MSSDRPVEYAMAQWPSGQRYLRPQEVRKIAKRLQGWRGSAETCKSCQSLPAVTLAGGMALCSRCREQREMRLVRFEARPSRVDRADDVDTLQGVRLRGYAIVTDSLSVDLGGFVEVIRQSALDRFEAENPDLRALWSHDPAYPMGRMTAGTMRAKRTNKGLLVEVEPPRGSAHHVNLIQRRDVRGQSFGFIAHDDEWHVRDDSILREVLDMSVMESSFVVWPAYPETTADVINADQRSSWYLEEQTRERIRLAR